MIHIKRSKDKQFYVTVTAANGEVLMQSETLRSKQAAWKNICAVAENFLNTSELIVRDETLKKPLNYLFTDKCPQ